MQRPVSALRMAVPQAVTASRLALAVAALVAAADGRLFESAALITVGAVTDGLDGPLARRFGAATPFGALFDYFADYVCYVVAPWGLARALVPSAPEWALALPFLTGAARYARNAAIVVAADAEVRELPGLGTVFAGFVPVTAVFLDATAWLANGTLAAVVASLTAAFAVLMVTPVRYPKLSAGRGLPPLVVSLLALMPFVGTRALAAAAFGLGLLYVVAAPFAARRGRQARIAAPRGDAGGDAAGV